MLSGSLLAQTLNGKLLNRLTNLQKIEQVQKIIPKIKKESEKLYTLDTPKYFLEVFLYDKVINEIHFTPKKSFLIQNIERKNQEVQLKGTIGTFIDYDHYYYVERPKIGRIYKIFRTGLIKYIVIKPAYDSELQKWKLQELLTKLQETYNKHLQDKREGKGEKKDL
jgi:hypothetical protein